MTEFQYKNSRAAKLTPGQVLEMRRLYADGYSQGRLAREYQVSLNQVGRIVRGEVWQSLPSHGLSEKDAKESLQKFLADNPDLSATEKMQQAIAESPDRLLDGIGKETKGEPDAGY